MPAKGTRKAIINGEEVFLEEEDARIQDLLQRGCELHILITSKLNQLATIEEEIAALAVQRRGGTSTVHIDAIDGRSAKVTWRKRVDIDPLKAAALKKRLGSAWARLFQTKTSYSLAKSFHAWMSAPQRQLDAVKKEIAKAVRFHECAPSVSFKDIGERKVSDEKVSA